VGGTLQLNKTGVNAVAGDVTVNSGTLLLSQANQIIDTSVVTIGGGTFDMAGNAETIGSLVLNSGTLTQGGATLSLTGTATTTLTMGNGTTIPGIPFLHLLEASPIMEQRQRPQLAAM